MRFILASSSEVCRHCFDDACAHSKPLPDATLEPVPYWEERTCSIEQFDAEFGQREGAWESKGVEHCEVSCEDSACTWRHKKDHKKHCRRRLPDVMRWCLHMNTLDELVELSNRRFLKIYLSTHQVVGTIIEL